MKSFLFAVLLIGLPVCLCAQNLVPNPSFEQHTGCPAWADEMYDCVDWWNAGGDSMTSTPDYFNSCSTKTIVSPPHVSIGYQVPHSGDAYCFVVTYDKAFGWYREYIQAELTSTLLQGQEYYVSLYASLPGEDGISYGSNKLGVLFTTYPFKAPNYAHEINFAQVYTDSVLTDTLNWIHLRGLFIADSSYQYLTIGNFFDDAHTDTINIDGSSSYAGGYYIDDVCVATDSASCFTNESVKDIVLQGISIYPNPADDFIRIEQSNGIPPQGTIINMLGQTVSNFESNNSNKIIINCSDWINGIYFLKTENQSKKIIIQHY